MSISIGKRILFGFVAVTVVIVTLGLYALAQIGAVRDATDAIVSRDLAIARLLDDIANKSREMGILRRNAVIGSLIPNQAAADQQTTFRDWRQTASETEALLGDLVRTTEAYRSSASLPDRAAVWEKLRDMATAASVRFRDLRGVGEAFVASVVKGQDVAATASGSAELNTRQDDFFRDVGRLRMVLDEGVAIGQRNVARIYERSRLSILLTLAASVLLSILVTALISRAVVAPLEEVMRFAARVGEGDLTGTLARTGNDEIGRLGTALNKMVTGLADLARTSRGATADMTAAAAEIRASAQEQAASVEEQFAAVQETAATVDEITHSGAQIGKRATEVIATAQTTAQTSRAGLRAMGDSAKAMDAIREQAEAVAGNIVSLSEKTQAIGEIITTVNDISERTHLLALNAAIEA
ncbi:MAG TPA: methyl-accepting chemotaxis protein, partial [Geminicoccaceae bacterium]